MNFEYFIAKRIIFSKSSKGTISSPIIKIAIVAIALGIIMMLIAIATGTGLQNKIREKISAFNGHIQIYNYDTNRSEVSVTPISLEQDFYPSFKEVPEVTHMQAVASKGGIIRTENTFEGIIAKGVGKDYNWKYIENFLTNGRLPNYKEGISNEILISDYLSNRLHLKVGDHCNTLFLKEGKSSIPNQRNFTIVGIYNSGFQDFDASYIFTDIRQIQHMNRWKENQVGNFELFIDNFSNLPEISNKVYANTSSTLDSQSIIDKYYFIFEWLGMFDFNIVLIIGIMIIVGGINMITAILVLILERTPMIGMLKALGSSNKSIRTIFLYNAGYLIFKGILWGNLIGISLLLLQKYTGILKLNPSVYYVSQVPIHLSISTVLLLNLGVFILCMLMLLIPSYIVAKISPVKAIKFE